MFNDILNEILPIACTLYLVYAHVQTRIEARKRIHDYTIESALAEIERKNTQAIKELKADNKLYIDKNMNRITTRIVETVKRIIKEENV